MSSPWRWEYDCEQIRDGHRHEDEVGGRAHVLLAQNDDDQDVGQEGDGLERNIGVFEYWN